MYTPKPFHEGYLPEQDGHKVYFAQYGNPDGEVIVSLHGGPGSASKSSHPTRFDLETYQVVVFDQRGAGKSEPTGLLEHNTTDALITDIERLREQLGIESWFVSGTSWGSTLSLLYAEAYPERVKGLLLSAIFLADTASWEWMSTTPDGAGQLYTDLWAERMRVFEKYGATAENAAQIFYDKLLGATPEEAQEITADYLNWEKNLLVADNLSLMNPSEVSDNHITYVKIFLHYEVNNCFIEDNQILKNVSKITDIPVVLIHGRHDVVCPFDGAWRLHRALPQSKLVALPQSNHAFTPDGEMARYWAYKAFLAGLQ